MSSYRHALRTNGSLKSKNMCDHSEETLQNIKRERNELDEWYSGIKYSSDNAWTEVMQGFINTYGSLSDSFNRTQSEFSKSDNKDRSNLLTKRMERIPFNQDRQQQGCCCRAY
ncbi:MAG: hypothetical protein RQ936_05330, partial [Gammaproteobacteria bacterium]|nr:hypothetical protein [Gammaproteobacteria bacterium]